MPVYLQIIGRKNSGKTSLIVGLARELSDRGYKIATVKHTSHDHDFDRPGTDSWKCREAGSEIAVINSPAEWVCHAKIPDKKTRQALQEILFRDKDLVFWEGQDGPTGPRIECIAPGQQSLFRDDDSLIAVVAEQEVFAEVPIFQPTALNEMVEWLIGKLRLHADTTC